VARIICRLVLLAKMICLLYLKNNNKSRFSMHILIIKER